MSVVVDASVTFAWAFEDVSASCADQVLAALDREIAVVPCLGLVQVTNALIVAERRQRLTAAQSTRFVKLLQELPFEIVDVDQDWQGDILSVAREQGASAYDATCLVLAMRTGAPLATLDRQLAQMATALGVKLFGH